MARPAVSGQNSPERQQSLGVETACNGEHTRPQMGPTQSPRTRVPVRGICRRVWNHQDAHRERNPTTPLQPWEEVKESSAFLG